MSENIEISVAKMEVQVENLEKDMADVKRDVRAIRTTLDKVDGSWKMLLMVGGFSAAVGGFVTKILSAWPFGR